jgi:hypothetical protein
MNVVFIVSCLLLAISYALPVEASWAPVEAWHGYFMGGEFFEGLNISLVEIFPYAAGVVALVAVLLVRRPKAAVLSVAGFGSLWVCSVVWYLLEVNGVRSLVFSKLWADILTLAVPSAIIVFVLALRDFKSGGTVLTLALLLCAFSLVQQLISIGCFLLLDKVKLNIGSVTGVAGATALFVGMLIRRADYLKEGG